MLPQSRTEQSESRSAPGTAPAASPTRASDALSPAERRRLDGTIDAYWGLDDASTGGDQSSKDERTKSGTACTWDEMAWIFTLSRQQFDEGTDHLLSKGWKSSARMLKNLRLMLP